MTYLERELHRRTINTNSVDIESKTQDTFDNIDIEAVEAREEASELPNFHSVNYAMEVSQTEQFRLFMEGV